MLTRTENYVNSRNVVPPSSLEKSSKVKSKKGFWKQKAIIDQSARDPIVGGLKVEAEVAPLPLQLQVQVQTPNVRRVTHSSTKKRLSDKNKAATTVNLEITEDKLDSELLMADSALELQKSPTNTESPEGGLAMTKFSPSVDKEPATPKWLENSI